MLKITHRRQISGLPQEKPKKVTHPLIDMLPPLPQHQKNPVTAGGKGGSISPPLEVSRFASPPPAGKSGGGVGRRERGSGAWRGQGEAREGVGKGEEGKGRAWGAKKEEKRDYFDQI